MFLATELIYYQIFLTNKKDKVIVAKIHVHKMCDFQISSTQTVYHFHLFGSMHGIYKKTPHSSKIETAHS